MVDLEEIKRHILESTPFQEFIARMKELKRGDTVSVRGVAGSLMAFLCAEIARVRGSQVLLIVPEADRAEKLRDDCAMLLDDSRVRYYGERASHHAESLDITSSITQIETLKALSAGLDVVVVCSAQSLTASVPPPDRFSQSVIEIRAHGEHNFGKLIDTLNALGFERKQFVEGYGDFAVRGGILDVFPFIGDNPIRIDFWGDTVESIREFDVLSQRSIRQLEVAAIVPDVVQRDRAGVLSHPEGLSATVLDYLKHDAVIVLDEPELVRKEIEERETHAVNAIGWDILERRAKSFPHIIHSILKSAGDRVIDFNSTHQPSFNGSVKVLVQKISELDAQNFHVYLTCDGKEEADRLHELIEEEFSRPDVFLTEIPDDKSRFANRLQRSTPQPQISYPASDILPETLHSGFIFPAAQIAVFTEHEVFGRLKRRRLARRRRFKGITQKELHQLKRNDYVVHADYGIGRFAGLQRISVRGAEQEVMKILYLENDVVYVNLNYIDRVQKYASSEGHIPKLTKLGAPDWDRLKARAKRRVKDIARDLIQLYALRKKEKGFAFSPDTHWQKEMEASFMYEDTPDQAQATLDVKRDMESESPMDRLICGDVGFGKTEVAVRAAFKAVQDGTQVAVLVPTTILAQQHFHTFKDRLGRYPVRIEFISRFKSRKEQTAIIEALRTGAIDIIIGTHRVLSGDVHFKNLGLLIIDEEHRFGVAAKEKLRRMKASVDTLTLTATPIPRTLHFALMGARDISLINTAPRNRLPVITEIAQFDWRLIRDAIRKEVHRGGQVYFVHDRVQNIEEMKSLLEEHLPDVRFAIAHGQMHGHQLEKVMVDFLEKKYDVLTCTKIIESGIDIPNVNTIIINRADRFGLAELYQLRGRVGRSNVQAYAYLLTPPISVLPKEALRRLQALEEFTELGSGFNLAMRDLEIRGAGNLLGAEQSGFIMEMGYEMYERIVREAVEELKQQEFRDVFETVPTHISHPTSHTTIEANIDAYIPDVYIESDVERLEIYRRLSRIEDRREIDELRLELRDRFGEYPPEVEHLLALAEIRLLAMRLSLPSVTLNDDGVSLTMPDDPDDLFYREQNGQPSTFQKIVETVSRLADGKFRFAPLRTASGLKQEKKSVTLVLDNALFDGGEHRVSSVIQFMNNLLESV